MLSRRLALAVIVTALSGCDNVSWGGAEVRLQAPPARSEMEAPEAERADSAGPRFAPPEGPLLLAGTREGDRASLVVVGELRGRDVLRLTPESEAPGYRDYLVSTVLAPGEEFILFSGGVRVGRLVAETAEADPVWCGEPAVTGTVELVPGAGSADRFLALPAPAATDRPYGAFRQYRHNYEQRVGSLNLASAAIPRVGAPWPPSLLEARADVQALRLPEAPGPSVAATFLFQDRLAVTPPGGTRAYSLFVLGTERDGEIRPAYTWFRRVADEGKGAPRYFGHLDWDGDGSSEILLEVFGEEARWFAGIASASGSWTRTFEHACGAAADPAR